MRQTQKFHYLSKLALACIVLLMPFSTALVIHSSQAIASKGLHLAVKADQVLVFKKSRKLQLRIGDMILREYPIALGWNPMGHKQYEGDGRTPEGKYTISWKNPNSDFFLSLKVSYPNQNDIENARKRGDSPGNMIMVHGLPNDKTAREVNHPRADWTNGCIALNNTQIVEIWEMVDEGTPITIYP